MKLAYAVAACAALAAVAAVLLPAVSAGTVSFGVSPCQKLLIHDALVVVSDVAFYVYVPQRSSCSVSEGSLCEGMTNNPVRAMVRCWRMKSASRKCSFPAELTEALREASLTISWLNAKGHHYMMPDPLYCNHTAIYIPVLKEWKESYLTNLINEMQDIAGKYRARVVMYTLSYNFSYVSEVLERAQPSISIALSKLGLSSEDWVWFYDFVTGRPLIMVNLSVKTPSDPRVYKILMALSRVSELTEGVKEVEVMFIKYYAHPLITPLRQGSTNSVTGSECSK